MTADASHVEVPCNARELYRKELHRQRTLAGLSFQQLAEIVNYSKPHIHGVETGTRSPLPPISERFDAAFGTGVLFQGMYETILKERPRKRFDHCLELEARAIRVQEYNASMVPGLLQTEPYMRALLSTGGADPKQVDQMVADRLSRQETLRTDNPPDFWAVLDEAILHRAVGGAAVMRDQLASLLRFADTPRTTIQIVPFEVGACALMSGTLILLTLPDQSVTVYEEGPRTGEVFDDQATVKQRVREYDRMKACALSPERSAVSIKAAMEKFNSCEPPRT